MSEHWPNSQGLYPDEVDHTGDPYTAWMGNRRNHWRRSTINVVRYPWKQQDGTVLGVVFEALPRDTSLVDQAGNEDNEVVTLLQFSNWPDALAHMQTISGRYHTVTEDYGRTVALKLYTTDSRAA
tara:strand:+ start:586 stop:960 length:375 start_codon:yes stop_codon:yes gene_type:complete